MDLERRCLQAGTVMVVLAIFLRLMGSGVLGAVLGRPEVLSLILFSETGRWVRPGDPQIQFAVSTQPAEIPTESPLIPTTPTTPTAPPTEQAQTPVRAVFQQEDAGLVQVNSVCGYDADLQTMLQKPLNWDLTEGGPAVLILHSHGTESYTKTEDYQESTRYRTLNESYNVVSIGDRLAQVLQAGGIEVIHDRTMHDYPSYNDAYPEARAAIARYLEEYPTIRMVLDIHRDAAETDTGQQVRYTVPLAAGETAQVMMVVGTDADGQTHPKWQENMALAVKLHAQLEKLAPGLCRPISFRSQRFNQDLSTGAMLIEVGSAGNTRQEALLAAEQVAWGVLALAHGTGEVY